MTPALSDALGPRSVRAPNLSEPLTLRPIVRILGGATLEDDPAMARSQLRCAVPGAQVVTIAAAELARGTHVQGQGVSNATLVRFEPTQPGVVQGLADLFPLGAGYFVVRARPNVAFKFLHNAGTETLQIVPSTPDEPLRAGVFLDTIALTPGLTVRIVWDHEAFAWRIPAGTPLAEVPSEALAFDGDGEALVFDDDADYLILG